MKKFQKFLTIFSVFLTSFVFMTEYSLAIGSTGGLDGKFEGWFTNVLTWIIGLAGLVAAAVLIFNAFLFITASGDEAKVKKATSGITYAIVGLVVAALAFLIVNYVIDKI
jgi:hypothetical protein